MKAIALLFAVTLGLYPGIARAEPVELFNGRLFLMVRVNDRPATALLDSAAEMTVLDDDFAADLGLAPEGSAVAHGSGADAMEARFVDEVAIQAAGTETALRAAVIDLGEVSTRLIGRPVDLLFGRELFDQHRVRIDVAGKVIALDEAAPPEGLRHMVTDERGVPTIPVQIDDEEVQAVFDLGNGSEVLIGKSYAERRGLYGHGRVVERRRGGGLGGEVEREIIRIPSLVVAGREYRDVPAAIDSGPSAADLNIGTSILRDFIIIADFPNRSVWLRPIN